MRLITQGRYATTASTAALVIALGGTSYAAITVTGADIKDNTVKTQDVKDRTLKLRDVSPRARNRLHGATGATGPAGATGATGPAGPRGPIGPSDVMTTFNDQPTVMDPPGAALLIMDLEPGHYLVQSKALAYRTASGSQDLNVQCQLSGPIFVLPTRFGIDESAAYIPDVVGAFATVENHLAFRSNNPSTVQLRCMGSNVSIREKKLTAIKVDSVTFTQAPDVP